jgi:hypothetical protein
MLFSYSLIIDNLILDFILINQSFSQIFKSAGAALIIIIIFRSMCWY